MEIINRHEHNSSSKRIFLIISLCISISMMGCSEKPRETNLNHSDETNGAEVNQSVGQENQEIVKSEDLGKVEDSGKAEETIGNKLAAAGQFIDDAAITAKVKSAIINEPLLKGTDIKVTTDSGTVRLSGTVDSQEKLDRALEKAQFQDNVKSVQNDLIIIDSAQLESEQAGQKTDQPEETIGNKLAAAGQFIDDAAITAKVKSAIISEPLLKGTDIKVTTDSGTVRLSGTVDSQEKLDRALEKAQFQDNVKSVQNDLIIIDSAQLESEQAGQKTDQPEETIGNKLAAAGRYIDDSVITADVKAALIDDPLLSATDIKVTTDNGTVRLSGTLDSQEKINRALEVAKNQKDVKSVQNDLIINSVQSGPEQAGEQIDEAGNSVNDEMTAAGRYIDDSVITANVKAALIDDPLLSATDIKVTTDNGTVRLSGTLDSQEKINRALEVAKNQKDVKSVQNDLIINSVQSGPEQAGEQIDEAGNSVNDEMTAAGRYIDDSVITANVKAALIDDPLLSATDIKVTADNGTVRLSGTLDSQEKINRALEVAKNQKDVKSVQSGLALGVPGQSAAELSNQNLD